jgi:hypothetical protein
MIGLGKTIEVQGVTYEIKRTLPIPIAGELDKELTDQIKEAWHAEKAFKSDQHGLYFFVDEVQDIQWEEIIESKDEKGE